MNQPALQTLMTAARDCAIAMLHNGTFIQQELPNVQIDPELRSQTEQICSKLIGTKHDILSELDEFDELISSRADENAILMRAARLIRWLSDDIKQLCKLVTALDAAAKRDPAFGLAYTLVAESTLNILNPFRRVKQAAESLQGKPSAG